jgi:hypothetical protein
MRIRRYDTIRRRTQRTKAERFIVTLVDELAASYPDRKMQVTATYADRSNYCYAPRRRRER